jgi:hypothetical protein
LIIDEDLRRQMLGIAFLLVIFTSLIIFVSRCQMIWGEKIWVLFLKFAASFFVVSLSHRV